MSNENVTEAVLTTTGEVLVKQADGSFRKAEGQTDWDRLDAMTDEDIDYSDIPELDEAFFRNAKIVDPLPAKQQLTIRLDEDVLSWLKARGRGYQTRINAILRAYYESHHVSR